MASRRSTVAAAVGLIFHFLLNLISFNGIFCYAACALYYKLLKNLPKIWFKRVFPSNTIFFLDTEKSMISAILVLFQKRPMRQFGDIFWGSQTTQDLSESIVHIQFANTNTIYTWTFFKP